jgi:hypothetical protein
MIHLESLSHALALADIALRADIQRGGYVTVKVGMKPSVRDFPCAYIGEPNFHWSG